MSRRWVSVVRSHHLLRLFFSAENWVPQTACSFEASLETRRIPLVMRHSFLYATIHGASHLRVARSRASCSRMAMRVLMMDWASFSRYRTRTIGGWVRNWERSLCIGRRTSYMGYRRMRTRLWRSLAHYFSWTLHRRRFSNCSCRSCHLSECIRSSHCSWALVALSGNDHCVIVIVSLEEILHGLAS